MPKIQQSKQGKFIYLPKAYMQLLGWNKGDTCAIFPDRTAKQTLVLQKTLDAKTLEPQQSVNAIREAPPLKIEVSQTQAPQQARPQPTTTPRTQQQAPTPQQASPSSPINPQQNPNIMVSKERLKQLMQQRKQSLVL